MLHNRGRYSHSEDYARNVLRRAGLLVVEITLADLRTESGKPVPGIVIVAQRPQS
jgi:predicted TPR repeat methyltransferase